MPGFQLFFLFNPFSYETFKKVVDRLCDFAKTRKIRIVSVGPSTSYFFGQKWLSEVPGGSQRLGLQIFESNNKA